MVSCPSLENDCTTGRPSLLGLPPEIRNQIYEHVAASTTLIIAPLRPRKPPAPSGLLLACRQTQREYRSLLLSTAEIIVQITGYSFDNLIRVLEKLRKEDVASLSNNSQLRVTFFLSHVPTREDRQNLRSWSDYRATAHRPDRIGGREAVRALMFQYDVRFGNHMRPPRPPSRYENGYHMKLDLLYAHARSIGTVRTMAATEGASIAELDRIQIDLQQSARILDELRRPAIRGSGVDVG